MTKIRVGSGIQVKTGRPSNIKVSEDGNFKGSQPEINFTGNANVTNDPTNNRVNVDIPASGGGGGAGSDTTAIHDNEANEISAITEKTVPTDDDLYLIEDSEASNDKKKAKRSSLFTWDKLIKGATVNRFYGSGLSYDTNSTGSTGINTLRASPFRVLNKLTLDTIQAEVSTAVGGSSFRIGIYADDGNCYPGALVVDSGVLSGASLGVVPASINVTLQPGLYWFVIVCDASITMRAWGSSTMPTIMGIISTMGSVTRQAFYTVSFTFAALPPTFPAGATINNSANSIAQILVRAI